MNEQELLDAIFKFAWFKSYGIEPFTTRKGRVRYHVFYGDARKYLCGLNTPSSGRPDPGRPAPPEVVYKRYQQKQHTCFGCMRTLERQRNAVDRLGTLGESA